MPRKDKIPTFDDLMQPDRINCSECGTEVEFSAAYKEIGHKDCQCGKTVPFSETAVSANKDRRAIRLRKLMGL